MNRYEGWHNPYPLHKFEGRTMTEHFNPRTVKELMRRPDQYTVEDGERSLTRLGSFVELLFSIDTGDFPLTHYSAGEKVQVKRYNRQTGETTVFEKLVDLPILPENNTKGLRYLVTFAIFSELNQLSQMGVGEEARAIIDAGRTHGR